MKVYIIWLIISILLFGAEAATSSIFSIWFAIGALVSAMFAYFAPDMIIAQLAVFLLVSVVTLYFTRPVLTKKLLKKTATNADMLIGKEAVVTQDISADNFGRVTVSAQSWRAKSSQSISKGEKCKILAIEGASVVVEKITAGV